MEKSNVSPQEMLCLASPLRELKTPRAPAAKQPVQCCLIPCFPVPFACEIPHLFFILKLNRKEKEKKKKKEKWGAGVEKQTNKLNKHLIEHV